MIRVSMELHSSIHPSRNAQLVCIIICNDGSGTATHGNYGYTIRGRNGRKIKTGYITNWPRLAKTPCALLQRVINDAYPEGAK